jgi:hypothetical protein
MNSPFCILDAISGYLQTDTNLRNPPEPLQAAPGRWTRCKPTPWPLNRCRLPLARALGPKGGPGLEAPVAHAAAMADGEGSSAGADGRASNTPAQTAASQGACDRDSLSLSTHTGPGDPPSSPNGGLLDVGDA